MGQGETGGDGGTWGRKILEVSIHCPPSSELRIVYALNPSLKALLSSSFKVLQQDPTTTAVLPPYRYEVGVLLF